MMVVKSDAGSSAGHFRRKITGMSLLLSAAVWLTAAGTSFALDAVNLHVSAGVSPNNLIYGVAKEKGFYQEEGLELLPIQAGMLPGIQGLVAGSFDFTQILGQSAGAIIRGLPLKIVMVFDTRPLNWLYASKNIKTIQELKGGKQVAVSSFGAALDQMSRELLLKYGVDPQRDVVLRALEPTPTRLAALMAGAVDAAVLNQRDSLIAKKNGFNELLDYGDHLEFVTAGVAATEKTLSQRPDFVSRFLRGTLKGFLWFKAKANESEAVSKITKAMNVTGGEASEIYAAAQRGFSVDGTIPRSLQERMIVFQKRSLKVEREISLDSVYDFRVLNGLNVELKKARF